MIYHSNCPICGGESFVFWQRGLMNNKFKPVTVELKGCTKCRVGFPSWEMWEEYVSRLELVVRKPENIEKKEGGMKYAK